MGSENTFPDDLFSHVLEIPHSNCSQGKTEQGSLTSDTQCREHRRIRMYFGVFGTFGWLSSAQWRKSSLVEFGGAVDLTERNRIPFPCYLVCLEHHSCTKFEHFLNKVFFYSHMLFLTIFLHLFVYWYYFANLIFCRLPLIIYCTFILWSTKGSRLICLES